MIVFISLIMGNKKSLASTPMNNKPTKNFTFVKRYCYFSFSDINPVSYDVCDYIHVEDIFDTFVRVKRYTLPRALLIDEF